MMKKKRRTSGYLILFLLTNLIFVILYRRFLLGNGVYMYLDIGSDSMSSSYPIIVLLGRLFRSRDFSSYSLSFGLGNDITTTFLQYLNPVKFLLLLFNEDTLPIGIMIMVAVVTNLTSLFSWLYFRMILKRDDAAFFPALMWTFSSYIVLWSQNLSFGCAMMMVTLTMLLLEHFLETPKFSWWLALLGDAALFLVTNYYFLYITAVFAALYMIIRGILLRTKFRDFINGFVKSVVAVLLSVLPAMIAVVPIVGTFTGSSRTSNVSSGGTLHQYLLDHLDLKRGLTILARIFSPNTLGLGDSYTGSVNYYEAALISTSILALFALFYLILKKDTRMKALLVFAVCVLMLAVPFTGQIMNMNVLSYRYSFVISFAECIAAGFFMKSLLEKADRKILGISALLTLLSTAAVLLLVKKAGASVQLVTEGRTLKLIALTTGLWFIFFLVCIIFFRPFAHRRIRFLFLPTALLLLCGELVVMNNDSLYLRSYVTCDMFKNSMYHNGVKEAVRTVKSDDPSLYRSVADATFNFANQGAVDNYPSTTAYYNTNPASMLRYDQENGMFQYSSNFFLSDIRQYPQFTMLSGKYLIKDRTNLLDMMVQPSLFTEVKTSPTARRAVFENKNALSFGYLYKNRMKHSTFSSLSLPEKQYAETQAYFETSESADTKQKDSNYVNPLEGKNISASDLGPMAGQTHNVQISTAKEDTSGDTVTTIRNLGEDPWITYHFDTSSDTDHTVHFLYLKLKDLPQTGNTFLFDIYYLTKDHPVADKIFFENLRMTADYPELCIMLPEGTTGIRFGIPVDQDQVVFRKMELISTDSLDTDFAKLRQDSRGVRNISYEERTDAYRASVSTDQDSMLCVPIFITKNWNATVNGSPVKIHDINGGLIGIPVKKGNNQVVLQYRVPHLKTGAVISLVALIAYGAAWIVVLRRKRSH